MLYKKISELPSGITALDADLIEISRQLTDAKKSYSLPISAVADNIISKIKPLLDDKISGTIYESSDTNDGYGIGLHWQGNGGEGKEGLPNFQFVPLSDSSKTPLFINLVTLPYFEKYTGNFVTGNFASFPDGGDGNGYDIHYAKRYDAPLFRAKFSDGTITEYQLATKDYVNNNKPDLSEYVKSIAEINNDQQILDIHWDGKNGGYRFDQSDKYGYSICGSNIGDDNQLSTSGHDIMSIFCDDNYELHAKILDRGTEKKTFKKILTDDLVNTGITQTSGDGWRQTGNTVRNFGIVNFPMSNNNNTDGITVNLPRPPSTITSLSVINLSKTNSVDFTQGISCNNGSSTASITCRNVTGGKVGGSAFFWVVEGDA